MRVAPLIASPGSGGYGPGHVNCHPLCSDRLALFTEEDRDGMHAAACGDGIPWDRQADTRSGRAPLISLGKSPGK